MKARAVEGHHRGPGHAVFCPACKCGHFFDAARWSFNGDAEKPTFKPSMLIQGHLGTDAAGVARYGTCHSFVTDGMVQFLTDCTHDLAGKTVPLEDF